MMSSFFRLNQTARVSSEGGRSSRSIWECIMNLGSILSRRNQAQTYVVSATEVADEGTGKSNYTQQFTKTIKELVSSNQEEHHFFTRQGECHRSLIGLNNVFKEMGFQLNLKVNNGAEEQKVEDVSSAKIAWHDLIDKECHQLIQMRSPGHIWFIKTSNGAMRVLSLYSGNHGFIEYMENTNEHGSKLAILPEHHYGEWFYLDDEKGIQFQQDMEDINQVCTDITKIEEDRLNDLDRLTNTIWGVNTSHPPEALDHQVKISAVYSIVRNNSPESKPVSAENKLKTRRETQVVCDDFVNLCDTYNEWIDQEEKSLDTLTLIIQLAETLEEDMRHENARIDLENGLKQLSENEETDLSYIDYFDFFITQNFLTIEIEELKQNPLLNQ